MRRRGVCDSGIFSAEGGKEMSNVIVDDNGDIQLTTITSEMQTENALGYVRVTINGDTIAGVDIEKEGVTNANAN
jgi:hypothetical protein